MQKILILFFLISLLGCYNKQRELELKDQIIKLEKENDELKEKLNRGTQFPIQEVPNAEDFTQSAKKYVFVLLIVEQEEFNPQASSSNNYKEIVSYNYCSGIDEFTDVDNDFKYKLMDQVQLNYFKENGEYKKGKVRSRECFVFSTYEEASKKREQYLTVK